MHRRSRFIQVTLLLAASDYRMFVAAARILRRTMHDKAPDIVVLLQSKLTKQDAVGLAEDYLDLVGWPHAERRVILPKSTSKRFRNRARLLTAISMRSRPPADLNRN